MVRNCAETRKRRYGGAWASLAAAYPQSYPQVLCAEAHDSIFSCTYKTFFMCHLSCGSWDLLVQRGFCRAAGFPQTGAGLPTGQATRADVNGWNHGRHRARSPRCPTASPAAENEKPRLFRDGVDRNWSLAVSYSHMAIATLPSALSRFTSVFGMGTGGSNSLLPPSKLFPTGVKPISKWIRS